MVKMKHCCKNVVILMPEPVAEPALNGLRLNLRIVSIVMFNFASYLTIGLPLAVLPGYVHDVMGFSAFWAGLVISLQYFATLLSRPHAGRYADLLGPKKIVVFGLCGCFLSGLGYLTAGLTASLPVISLLLLCLGRVILGIGQSFAGTGSTLWGVGVVGSLHIGRVISWNGIVTYGAMAMGAPLGVVFYHWGGLQALALIIMGVALVAILLAIPRPTVKASKGKPLPFRAVLGSVWLYGMALALASAGFGVIATFITLFYDAQQGLADKPLIDKEIGEVLATHDETQRQALYRDILTRLHDEAVYLPISYISMMVVSKPELGNIPYAPIATEIPFEQIKPVKP